jgi:hypothetical protein
LVVPGSDAASRVSPVAAWEIDDIVRVIEDRKAEMDEN